MVRGYYAYAFDQWRKLQLHFQIEIYSHMICHFCVPVHDLHLASTVLLGLFRYQ